MGQRSPLRPYKQLLILTGHGHIQFNAGWKLQSAGHNPSRLLEILYALPPFFLPNPGFPPCYCSCGAVLMRQNFIQSQ